MVSIDKGLKVYKGVDVVGGKPVPTGWKIGKTVQRCHEVYESDGMLLLVRSTKVISGPPFLTHILRSGWTATRSRASVTTMPAANAVPKSTPCSPKFPL